MDNFKNIIKSSWWEEEDINSRDFYIQKYKNKLIDVHVDRLPDSSVLNMNKYNFLLLHEPNEFFGWHSRSLSHKEQFTAILTWNDLVLNNCSNAIKFTYNGVTLDNDFVDSLKEKQFNISFLCGTKDLVEGHKLRHKVYELESQITIPKKWYYVLEDYDHKNNVRPGYGNYEKDLSHIPEGVDIIGYGRRVLFKNSMFNVVVENVIYNNWYNKIGDNFITKTVPIYWGCPNISEFGYNERGIIRFETSEQLLEIINNLSPEKYYEMLPYINHNYELVKSDTFKNNMVNFLDEFIKLNNI